jgi:signal transduction histidine kinase
MTLLQQFGFILLLLALCPVWISAQPHENLQFPASAVVMASGAHLHPVENAAPESSLSRLWQQYKPLLFAALLVIGLQLGFSVLLALEIRQRKTSGFAIQALNDRIIGAAEEERKRIARELHDDIGQRLSLVSIELDVLKQDSFFKNEEALPSLNNILLQINEVISDLHNLSHQLHASRLEVLGLEMAVNELCKQIAQQHNVEIEFRSHNIPSHLQEDIALCFYRVAQEALNNFVKHSGSTRAAVRLHCIDNSLRMTIKDYGIGFDPTATAAGLGLATMRERLGLVGGDLVVHARLGKGTALVAQVSLRFPGNMLPIEHNLAARPTSHHN